VRIADICEFYAPEGGGVRTYVRAKLRAAHRLGHEAVIIAPGPRNAVEDVDGGRIIWVRAPRLPLDHRYRMFWAAEPVHRILDRLRPDVVEGSSPWRAGWIAARWCGQAARTLFMHLDPMSAFAYTHLGSFAPRERIDRAFDWFWTYLKRLASRFDAVICPSNGLAARLRDNGIGCAEGVRLGVEPGVFSPALRSEQLRAGLLERCCLDADATLLIGAGRHTPEKRWPVVIDAFRAVAARRRIGLVLIGAGHATAALTEWIAGDPHVQLVAPIWDRPTFAQTLASGDVLIHGSAAETFGLVPAEALASGLPLVLPHDGAAADFGNAAWSETYRAGDARSAAMAINRVLDRPIAELRTAAALAPSRTLDDHFDELFARYDRMAWESRVAA